MHIVKSLLWCAALTGSATTFARPPAARAGACANLLAGTSEQTLAPEAGSVEDRVPGTAHELRQLLRRLHEARVRGLENGSRDWPRALPTIAADLMSLAQSADPRLEAMVAPVLERLRRVYQVWRNSEQELMKIGDEVRNIQSGFFELLVASHLAGRRIHMNERLSDLFPESDDHREIDIAIERGDGTWRWVEVKDWKARVARAPHMQEKLFKQAHDLRAAAARLTVPRVQLELVMRYALSPDLVETYRAETGYDHIRFVHEPGAVEEGPLPLRPNRPRAGQRRNPPYRAPRRAAYRHAS